MQTVFLTLLMLASALLVFMSLVDMVLRRARGQPLGTLPLVFLGASALVIGLLIPILE